jgi:tetratricopeptide (TPR) repeat protein
LALAIVAARAAANPHFPLAAITAKLKQGKGTLEGFRDGAALDVRSVFSWSYRILTPTAARLFRLLSVHTGTDTSTVAAANLAGLSRDETQDLLDELARMRFLTEREPGRFVAHDLIRAYAMELRDQYDSHDEQVEAIGRLLDYYMQSAYEANLLMRPHQIPDRPPLLRDKVTPEIFADNRAAMEWFEAERKVLADLVRTAPAHGFPSYSWSLAFLLQQYYHRRGLLHDWEATMSAALAIATNAGDKTGQASMHRSVAGALHFLGRRREALVHLEQTEKLFDELGYTAEHAYVNSNFGTVLTLLGEYPEAIERHRRALRLYEQMKDKKGQAISYEGIGECQGKLGNHDEAILLTTRAMSLYKGINELNGEGACWRTLGEVYHDLGAYDEAIRCFEPAARICRELVNRTEEVEVMISMGDTMYAAGMTGDAVSAWRSALALIEELRLPRAEEIHERISRAA